MKKHIGLFLITTALLTAGCGSGDTKKGPEASGTNTTANTPGNFNTEADAAPGAVISELNYTEKDGETQKTGKRITKFFEDSTKVVVTIYKKANNEVYDISSYTVEKAGAKGLKADLTPMNDGGDNYTTYTPATFGAVSLVFVADGSSADTKIVAVKSQRIFMNEKKTDETRENGFNMPVADFKTAEEWVKKLAASFGK